MEVINDNGQMFRGKMGNMIYYTMNGRTFARRASIPGKERKPQTEKQRGMSKRFGMVQKMYSFYMKKISPDIWRLAAKALGKRAHNLFYSENCGCFNGEGAMVAPEMFRFSAGELLLPRDIKVEATGEGNFRVTWTEERELVTAASADELRVGVIYDSTLLGLTWANTMEGRRGEGAGTFSLDTDKETGAHVYLFFARADGSAYSPSWHVHVEL